MPGSGSDLEPSSSHSSSGYYRRHVPNGVDANDDGEVASIVPDRTGKHAFCRLCLTHSDKLRPLFPPDSAPDPNLLAQISNCVEVQITLPDDIKSFICLECVQQIYSFASFKELCKSNDQLLKSQTITRGSDGFEGKDGGGDNDSDEDDDDEGGERSELVTPEVTIFKREPSGSYIPDPSLLEKLLEQGVEVEAIGQSSGNLSESNQYTNSEDREAERKAKNAARMRRWRLRQRLKQEQQLVQAQDKMDEGTEQHVFPQQQTDEQEEALRLKQAQELFAFFAQHQLRQVEAELRRLKESANNQQQQQHEVEGPSIKIKPTQLQTEPDQSISRQSSPNSDKQMASLRRSRAEYMRKWRAKRQSQQNHSASFGLVGRPPVTISPAQSETEKLVVQRNNRAEYMRRWRRERLKQELSPEEFDEWCIKSEQRRRFREWQVVRESASSTGDDTMDYGEVEAEQKVFPFDPSPLPRLGQS
ncbi:trichohyalin-like [Wyeomyia smithii]|uniref:trichohyalin-like n=1 Tax=Wyeomyia smithii TaxID=174621 RepID=UPI0024680862|nr:trichohyalin-like [Wyeomyia smithii]